MRRSCKVLEANSFTTACAPLACACRLITGLWCTDLQQLCQHQRRPEAKIITAWGMATGTLPLRTTMQPKLDVLFAALERGDELATRALVATLPWGGLPYTPLHLAAACAPPRLVAVLAAAGWPLDAQLQADLDMLSAPQRPYVRAPAGSAPGGWAPLLRRVITQGSPAAALLWPSTSGASATAARGAGSPPAQLSALPPGRDWAFRRGSATLHIAAFFWQGRCGGRAAAGRRGARPT